MPRSHDKTPFSSTAQSMGSCSFEDLCASSHGVFWTKSLPAEKGKVALFSLDDRNIVRLAENHSVKTRVHEYGGGAIACDKKSLFFISDTHKALIHFNSETEEETLLYQSQTLRFAEMILAPCKPFLYLIAEEHADPRHIDNSIYLFRLDTKELIKVHSGHDFYMSIAVAPKGNKLCFIAWDHPSMSWDESSLWVLKILEDGRLSEQRKVAAEPKESVLMPLWRESGSLSYVSDKRGFWNVYEYDGALCHAIYPMDADFSFPHWKLGRKSMIEVKYHQETALLCIYTVRAIDGLMVLSRGKVEKIDTPFTSITHLAQSGGDEVFFFAAGPTIPRCLVRFNLSTKTYMVIDKSIDLAFDEAWISLPEEIEFPSSIKGQSSYAFYYPPKAKNTTWEKPRAVIVRAHGGPTGHNSAIFSLDVQHWTSQGFGFLDVNYSGSSGFGKGYRDRLKGKWGVYDVQDCILAAKYLAEKEKVSSKRLFIKGSSSGGYTALRCLTADSTFLAAVSYYGIADLESLTKQTHKFELHYLDSLVGPYPQSRPLYRERSVIHHIDKIQGSVLLFQGKEDKVVDPLQAENMFLKLKENNVSVKLFLFDDEGHGFRRAETIEKVQREELNFYLSFELC